MNKSIYQTMFSSTFGNIYQFVGEVIDGENPVASITEKFIKAAGSNLMSIVVVQYNNTFILYTDFNEAVSDSDFEFLTDLTPDVVPEVIVTEQPPEVV
jgi:hypothetical protein